MNRLLSILYLVAIFGTISCSNKSTPEKFSLVDSLPAIFPDYENITIPLNIAPLNFKLVNNGFEGLVKVETQKGFEIIKTEDGNLIFPKHKWHKLLSKNINDTIKFTVFSKKNDGSWIKYKPFFQFVSADSIDPYLAYRLINTGYVLWEKLGIYQRNLENFDQDPIIENTSIKSACINCHSFCVNSPETMMFHVRKYFSGTVILHHGEVKRVETKTKYTLSSGVYPSWHPNGNIIALSVNQIGQQFHANTDKRITVSDKASDIILYNVLTNEVTTNPQVSTKWRENLPTWSPDGKYLYYISAPQRLKDPAPIDAYEPYSLLRIPYNAETNEWGKADTLIRYQDINGSITFPKPSPDGNYLVFTKTKNGYFSIHDQGADLYLLNLKTGEISKPDINSDYTDSYHSWSHNGRWMVLSSKRPSGLFTRPNFTHFSADGQFSKPFMLPQKDPDFYNRFLFNYNIPEFITGKVKVSPIKLRDAITGDVQQAEFDKSVDTDALSGATAKTN